MNIRYDIAKILKEVFDNCSSKDCTDCEYMCDVDLCRSLMYADALVSAGYRKADEVRKETARAIFNRVAEHAKACQESDYDGAGFEDIKLLAAEYGVEVEE